MKNSLKVLSLVLSIVALFTSIIPNYAFAKTKVGTTQITKFIDIKENSIKINWKKINNVSGYQIKYSTDKDFEFEKKITIKGNKTSKTISKLKTDKKYYFKVRAYKKNKNKTTYSKWSKVKSVRTTAKESSKDNGVKEYGPGETWNADGYFEVTVYSAKRHYFCNQFEKGIGYNDVVTVTMDIKNIKYDGNLLLMHQTIYDSDKDLGEGYPCRHDTDIKAISKGYSQNNATNTFMVKNADKYIYLEIDETVFNNNGYKGSGCLDEKAIFKIPVS